MPENQDKYFTELDKELQQLAMVDWPTFCQLLGDDAITSAKVCILKSRGKSLNQIATKLSIGREKVRYDCNNKCVELQHRK